MPLRGRLLHVALWVYSQPSRRPVSLQEHSPTQKIAGRSASGGYLTLCEQQQYEVLHLLAVRYFPHQVEELMHRCLCLRPERSDTFLSLRALGDNGKAATTAIIIDSIAIC